MIKGRILILKIVNYPYMCSNIPAKPTYGVYVSQLIRISRICDNDVSFVKRHQLLTERLIKQGFWYNKLSVSFKKFSRRHPMLFNKYAVSVKRHIREGICIPLDVKPDLVRNITTRNRVVVVNVHSVQVVVAVVCNDDLVCMVCKCTAVCHVLLGYIVLELTIASLFFTILPVL